MEVLWPEDVLQERTVLLLVEERILDKGLHIIGLHELVVLLAAVARVRHRLLRECAVGLLVSRQEVEHRGRAGVPIEGVVGDELPAGPYQGVYVQAINYAADDAHGVVLWDALAQIRRKKHCLPLRNLYCIFAIAFVMVQRYKNPWHDKALARQSQGFFMHENRVRDF